MGDKARIAAFILISAFGTGLLFWIGAHLSGGCTLHTMASVIAIGC